ncbi:MAG: Eco57I restriction-modification methylase domain-containing protein [Gammaproteobacteria bacterium]
MEAVANPRVAKRYEIVTQEKSGGATYTPKILADFVARQIVEAARELPSERPLRILDPAVGHGELLISLLEQLTAHGYTAFDISGFETDENANELASARIRPHFPIVTINFQSRNFLEFVLENFAPSGTGNLFASASDPYDLIIANPPYVRTQIMGARQAQLLAEQFGLSGRVDLYYAFILGMAQVLKPKGIAGIIVSNRFITTKSGAAVRHAFLERFNVQHVWDLGDTKLFDAAVLPAILVVEGKNGHAATVPTFTSIYQTSAAAQYEVAIPRESKGHSSRALIDACKPYERRNDFPPIAESSEELKTSIREKWRTDIFG